MHKVGRRGGGGGKTSVWLGGIPSLLVHGGGETLHVHVCTTQPMQKQQLSYTWTLTQNDWHEVNNRPFMFQNVFFPTYLK